MVLVRYQESCLRHGESDGKFRDGPDGDGQRGRRRDSEDLCV